jgi:predicted RNA binding protein YcfA (HicA-like mRNA interferase family)
MKIPRDLSSDNLIRLLDKYGYNITRQTGSHIRLTSALKGKEHHITIPDQKSLKVGTISNIIGDIAEYLEVEKKDLLTKLFV